MPRKKLTKKTPSRKTIALFIIGLSLILISFVWKVYQERVLSFNSETELNSTIIPYFSANLRDDGKIPQAILIPSLNIDLPIIESQIKNGVWEINKTGASHLGNSARPTENGNIIMYGHNKLKLFGKTLSLKKGDLIEVITKDNQKYTYRIFETKTVNSNEISVLAKTEEEILTFYTCTGLLDSKRFIIKAKPYIPL